MGSKIPTPRLATRHKISPFLKMVLLFSLPVHEQQEIVENQIENILKHNPGSKIMIHVNPSFSSFKKDRINYPNVFINSKQFNLVHSQGLLWIHVHNYLEAINLNIEFDHFALISSNEMFIRGGLLEYVEKNKNGIHTIEKSPDVGWHIFQNVNFDEKQCFRDILAHMNTTKIYGGQAEGNFFEKETFAKITDIFLNVYKACEIDLQTEEVVLQTIFMGLKVENYTLPFTLQNYSNIMPYTNEFITDLLAKKIVVPHGHRNYWCFSSPHLGKNIDTIFSIKRVDRNKNSLRDFINTL